MLARLGDRASGPDAWFLPNAPLLGFVEVPAGPFSMGTDPEDLPAHFAEINEIYRSRNTDWFIADETPMHEVSLPTCYVPRYPVTVGRFMAFLAEEDFRRLLRRPSLRHYTLGQARSKWCSLPGSRACCIATG